MPTFCRHSRLEENCPICSRKPRVRPGTVAGQTAARAAAPKAPRTDKPAASRSSSPSSSKRRTPRAGEVKVRRQRRSIEDGYEHGLVPGLKASDDARHLARELAFATARLAELASDPPGPLAEAAVASDPEEALWTVFLVAYLSPLEDVDEPFAAIEGVRTAWSAGDTLDALAGVPAGSFGPRTGVDPRRGATETVAAYRARAERSGGQVAMLSAEASLTPARRFERAFERLSLPRFPRPVRYELLVLAGGLGLLDVQPSSLLMAAAEPLDPALIAAKRIFGIGDAINLQRRASELVAAGGVTAAALDLALVNWARPAGERITAGSAAVEDPEVAERVAAALGVELEPSEDGDDDV